MASSSTGGRPSTHDSREASQDLELVLVSQEGGALRWLIVFTTPTIVPRRMAHERHEPPTTIPAPAPAPASLQISDTLKNALCTNLCVSEKDLAKFLDSAEVGNEVARRNGIALK